LFGCFAALALCGCSLQGVIRPDENAPNDAETNDGRTVPDTGGNGASGGDTDPGPDAVQRFVIEVFVTPEGAGTVSMDPPGGVYDEKTEVTFVATPSPGFGFIGYTGDVIGAASEVSIVVDRDVSITAEFQLLLANVSVSVEPPGAGAVELEPSGGKYAFGTTVNLNAVAGLGFSFSFYLDESGDEVSTQSRFSFVAEADMTLTALFVSTQRELFNVTVDVEPDGAGTVVLVPPGGLYELGTTVTLTATANAGFVFEAFADVEGSVVGVQPVYTLRVEEDMLLIARFAASVVPRPPPPTVTLSVVVTPPASGTVVLDPPGSSYPVGTVVTLTATPAGGYEFVRYMGDVSGTSPTTTVTMNANKNVQAEFVWSPRLGNPGNLLVTGFAASNVTEFDRFNGATLGVVVPPASGGLTLPGGIDFGSGGDIFVASFTTNEVIRYQGSGGALIGTFATLGGNFSIFMLRFGPNGNLFVGDTSADRVLEFDGTSGALVGTFVASRSGGLDNPVGLAFGRNGNLFVVSQRTNSVIEYNGTSGALVGTFADLGRAGFTVLIDLVFNAAGDAFVTTSGNDSVARVDGATRAVTTFVSSGSGGLDSPAGIHLHPDTGNLLVVNQSSNQVLEYDGGTGEFTGVFANGAGGENLFFMAFRPR